jgi:small-conductance mechanosensitive channel
MLVAVIAVQQLGVSTDVLVAPLTALLATAGFAAGLAFARGAHPIITHILAGQFLKQSLPRDSFVEVEGRRGVVERIGPTDTLLRNGDERWSIPNAQLLNQVVTR